MLSAGCGWRRGGEKTQRIPVQRMELDDDGWQKKAARAKRKHRPSLKNWEADGLAYSFPKYANAILESNHPYRSFRLVEKNDDMIILGDNDYDDGVREQNGRKSRWGNHKKVIVEERRQSLQCSRRSRRHGHPPKHSPHTTCEEEEETLHSDKGDDDDEAEQVQYPIILHASETPPSIFHELYESQCMPVIIRDIPLGYHHRQQHRQQHGGDIMRGNSHTSTKKAEDEADSNSGGRDHSRNCKNVNRFVSIPNLTSSSSATSPFLSSTDMNTNNITTSEIQSEWPAIHRWTIPSLSNDTILLDRPFKVGEDDDGNAVHMKLRHFLQYMQCNHDDSPLYIFDATFDEDKRGASRLLKDYTVPTYFNEDLMSLVGEHRRPPYRWFLVGPCRSGTTVHIDPLGTSAWNALIVGVKRWVLFPPHVPKSIVKGNRLILPGEDDEAIHYFTTILPRMKRRAVALAAKVNNCHSAGKNVGDEGGGDGEGGCCSQDLGGYANFECYEFTQYPGETVFIPHGWWHAVLNLTDTVGITQNYCSRRNFDAVWTQARSGRKKMSCSWLRKLDITHPDLAYRARELNVRDGYVMFEENSPAERARRERKRAERRERKEAKEQRKVIEGEDTNKRHGQKPNQKHNQSKEGKWGDHRIEERRRDDGGGDGNMREVSPD